MLFAELLRDQDCRRDPFHTTTYPPGETILLYMTLPPHEMTGKMISASTLLPAPSSQTAAEGLQLRHHLTSDWVALAYEDVSGSVNTHSNLQLFILDIAPAKLGSLHC